MTKVPSLLAILLAAGGLRAAVLPSGTGVTGEVTFASEYVFRGVEHATSSVQPTLELIYSGLNAGIWTNQPLTSGEADEVDVYLGYRRNVGGLTLEGVATLYWHPEAKGSLGETRVTHELGVGVFGDIGRITPSLYIYHDFTLNSETVQGAIGYGVPFDDFGPATIDFNFYAGAVSARDVASAAAASAAADAYGYFGTDISMNRRLRDYATLTVGMHYADTLNLRRASVMSGHQTTRNLWFSFGMTVGF